MTMVSRMLISLGLIAIACDQKVYDEIYLRIIQETMKTGMTKADFDIRNDTIEKLRELCQGQISSWEKAKNP